MMSNLRASDLLEALVDALLIVAGYAVALWMLFGTTIPEHNVTALRDTLPIACVGGFVLLAVYGLYAERYRPFRETLINLAAALGLLAVGVSALAFFLRGFAFPRFVLVMAPVLQMGLLSCWHGLNHLLRRRKRGVFRVAVVGREPLPSALLAKMEHSCWDAWLEGDVSHGHATDAAVEISAPHATPIASAGRITGWAELDGVLLLSGSPETVRSQLALDCARSGKTLLCMPEPADILLTGAGLRQFGDVPVLAVDAGCRQPQLQWAKRLFDMLFAFVSLVVLSPFFLLTMLLVRLSGDGPVFFVQERVTAGGRTFRLVKFRTMVQDAEKKTGPVLSVRNDPRITPIGRFLRKVRLDELPQLWNILWGDMSLVGPRPERPVFVERFERETPGYELRHAVRAGLTGLAQVYGNYATTAGDKLAFDLIYIRDWSLLLDLQIILRTVTAVFRREAAEGVVPADEEAHP